MARRPEETLDKTVSHFLPLSVVTAEEADRHYERVHTRFARQLLRQRAHVVSYHTARAVAQYDAAGGWAQRPRAFRFIVLRFLPGRGLELPDESRAAIVEDHRAFLRELRPFRVREEVLLDRLRGQTALEKYVFELDRPEGASREGAGAHLRARLRTLTDEAATAFGLRQLLVDHVLSEGATEAVDEPGQRSLPHALADTPRQAFLELYFDHREWAEEFFARAAVRAVLQDRYWQPIRGYRVVEKCGLDRR
jgi:hypothetical protein